MVKKIVAIAFTLAVILSYGNAQVTGGKKDTITQKNTDPLKGLKKAGPDDIDPDKPLMLDGVTIPVYSENLSLIQGSEFMKTMMSGDYIPEPFIDSNKEVKAFVLRKATEEEKKQMFTMQNDMQTPKELVGEKALPFVVTDISGNSYSLEKLKGKVIVLNFWFIECKPCIMEIPELNGLVDKYKNKNVVFLGFANNDKLKIENFLKTKPYKYNIIPDSRNIAQVYGVNAFPTHLIIDKNSIISYFVSGLGGTTIEDMDKIIESLTK